MIDHASEMAAFVRVVDSNGFSAAAPALGLSPSAVSKLITRLEARLGVRLLQRTTRALHLTQEGEVFYAAAKRIVGEIETLENQIAGQSSTPSGVLRVTGLQPGHGLHISRKGWLGSSSSWGRVPIVPSAA